MVPSARNGLEGCEASPTARNSAARLSSAYASVPITSTASAAADARRRIIERTLCSHRVEVKTVARPQVPMPSMGKRLRPIAVRGHSWETAAVSRSGPADHPFTPDLFTRTDESDDATFYAVPRKVVHLDEPAVAAVTAFFAEQLPPHGELLDVMASWRSHLPKSLPRKRVVGLGMNGEEMADNPDLDAWVVHDLNRHPELPFADRSFDAATLTVSMQ